MTSFWARMLVFKAWEKGEITNDCASYFDSLIAEYEYKKERMDDKDVATNPNNIQEIYKEVAEKATRYLSYYGFLKTDYFYRPLQQLYTGQRFKREEIIKEASLLLIESIAKNIQFISFEQGYRIGNDTVYLEHILGEETPVKFVDFGLKSYDKNNSLGIIFTKFNFDKPLEIGDEDINLSLLKNIMIITDYLEHKVKWQKTGELRDHYEKRAKWFGELENRCRRIYEEKHYNKTHNNLCED